MKFSISESFEKREPADLIVVPYFEGPAEATHTIRFQKIAEKVIQSGDFKGKAGEGCFFYLEGEKEPRLLLVGLGKKESVTPEQVRKTTANVIRAAHPKKIKSINVIFPKIDHLKKEEILRSVAEGLFLTNYAFVQLKGDSLKESPFVPVEKVGMIGLEPNDMGLFQKMKTICDAVCFTRDLVNGNADDITPEYLTKTALELAQTSPHLKTTIFDRKWMEKEKMGLLLAVARGSFRDPYFIRLDYQGDPSSKERTALVGKGITYDTGGLSLKPTEGMMTMKCDMGGAGAIFGAMKAIAALGLKVNITMLLPVTENAIGSRSYKPGDVYRSYSGKTVEIGNTDAEGRLVLADALSYAVKHLSPTCVIDLATLTGGAVVALGEEISALFSDCDPLAKDLKEASRKTGELTHQLPLHKNYKELLKSDVADLINVAGRNASAMTAALFLKEFTNNHLSWAHIDIAGPAFVAKPKYYNTSKATGYGVRLLVEFFEMRASHS